MPGRKPRTYGNWSSDVNADLTSIANRGRTWVAGVMPGACYVKQVFEIPKSGSVLQVEAFYGGVCLWQGSHKPFECSRVVPGIFNDESSDVHVPNRPAEYTPCS